MRHSRIVVAVVATWMVAIIGVSAADRQQAPRPAASSGISNLWPTGGPRGSAGAEGTGAGRALRPADDADNHQRRRRSVYADGGAARRVHAVGHRSGYLDTVYGARRPGLTSRGTVLRLVGSQKIADITLRMMRGSVITGAVIDEFGDPAYNVPVRAMRFYYDNGYRALGAGGNAITDDRGVYRIAGLQPGEYLVSAVPRDTVAAGVALSEAARDRQAQILAAAKTAGKPAVVLPVPPAPPSLGYVPIYYPGTPLGATAGTVRVGASEEVPGIDIRLQVIQTVTVAGKISSTEGTIPQSRLQLIDASLPINGVGIWFRDMRSDGSFSFSGVVPGSYIVKAHGTPGGQVGVAGGEMWSSVDINVDTRGADGVELSMKRGVTVSGQLALDALPATVNRSGVRLSLSPISSPTDWEVGPVELALDPSGQFTARNVMPGQYRFVARGLPEDWSIDSAVMESKDAADLHLQIDGTRNLVGVSVTLTSRRADLAGTVSTATGGPARDYSLLLFPVDRRMWLPQSRRIHLVQAGPDGRYAIGGLPAGEYRLAALLDPEPGREFDPEFLTQIIGASIAVQLAAGETKTLDVRVK